ncbi:MAG: hypothetical protein H7A53_08915 [Akkermansiaceae bacterium]|nr:hypothetical protein [Akkermansiaceae bacterium]
MTDDTDGPSGESRTWETMARSKNRDTAKGKAKFFGGHRFAAAIAREIFSKRDVGPGRIAFIDPAPSLKSSIGLAFDLDPIW